MKDWETWISDFRETMIKTYTYDPKRIREDFGSETRVKDDYKGRVILELLQNADDAQVTNDTENMRIGDKNVILYLKKDAFYCVNGGYPVTQNGLEAICRLSHSPKKDRKLYIGEKGLGFKSVLCFTDRPEIHSGDLHCKFNRNDAMKFLYESNINGIDNFDSDNIALFRFPQYLSQEIWMQDKILTEFAKENATVIKLKITDNNYILLKEKLLEIKSTILLFLNSLNKISIRIEEEDSSLIEKDFTIHRTENQELDNQCILEDGNNKSIWQVYNETFEIEKSFIGDTDEQVFQDINACKVSFALQKEELNYKPLDNLDENYIRVYFPTCEEFSLPFLFHASYYTDSSRKNINLEHEYNRNLTKKAVDIFIDTVLPKIMNNKTNICNHIDLLVSNLGKEKISNLLGDDYLPRTVGELFCQLVYKKLSKMKFIPNSDGMVKLPMEVSRFFFPYSEWENWYSDFTNQVFTELNLVNIDFTKLKRCELLDIMGVKDISIDEILDCIEKNYRKEVEWFRKAYILIQELKSKLDYYERKKYEETLKMRKILLSSDNEIVCSNDIKVFMNPGRNEFVKLPSWINIKFINSDLVKSLAPNREKAWEEYLDDLGVKRFQAREVLREVLSVNIKKYWEVDKNNINEIEMIKFTYQLFRSDDKEMNYDFKRPEKETLRILKEIPIPCKGNEENINWIKAGECYFSEDWTGNNLLEELYNGIGNFVCDKKYYIENIGLNENELYSFLYFVGVEDKPRIIELRNKYLDKTVHSKEYWRYITKKNEHYVNVSNQEERFELISDFIIDKIYYIVSDSFRAKVLLNYLAQNINIINGLSATVSYKPYRSAYTYTTLVSDSYIMWLLRNMKWLYDKEGNALEPKDIFFIDKGGINKNLIGYVPQVSYKIEKIVTNIENIKVFLINIGVKSDLNSLDARHWYNILYKVVEKYENEDINSDYAEKIRSIYRAFIRSDAKINNEISLKAKNEFIKSGKLLATYQGKYKFYSVSEILYADKLDLLNESKLFVPCFQVDVNRESRIKHLFDIPSLSKSLTEFPEFGQTDETLVEIVNRFIDDAKPYILARMSKQEDIKKETVDTLQKIKVKPVTHIYLESIITDMRNGLEIEIPKREVESYVPKPNNSDANIIYICSRILSSGEQIKMQSEVEFILNVSNRLCELFNVDLNEAFITLLSKGSRTRMKILRSIDIDEEKIDEFVNELVIDENIEVEDDKQEFISKDIDVENKHDRNSTSVVETIYNSSTDITTYEKRKVINLDFNNVVYSEEHIEGSRDYIEPVSDTPARTVGYSSFTGGNNSSSIGRVNDSDQRKTIEEQSMKIAMDYERKHGRKPDDSPSKQRRSKNNYGPGCDIQSVESDGKIRKIEVKASLDDIYNIELTQSELDNARSNSTGTNYYIYRVVKLDMKKYHDGPEIYIFRDPYLKCPIHPIKVRMELLNAEYTRVKINTDGNHEEIYDEVAVTVKENSKS